MRVVLACLVVLCGVACIDAKRIARASGTVVSIPVMDRPAGSAQDITCTTSNPLVFDSTLCNNNCAAYFDSGLDSVTYTYCQTGCSFAAEGGMSFCQCACVSMNQEAGYNACKTGCGLALQISQPATATTTVATVATTEPVTEEPSSTTVPTTTEPFNGVCADDNQYIEGYFAALMGKNLECSDVAEMGGCTNAQFMNLMTEQCPVTCGFCIPSDTTGEAPTSKIATIPTAEAPSTPIKPGTSSFYIVLGVGLAFMVVLVALVVVIRKRRSTAVINKVSHNFYSINANDTQISHSQVLASEIWSEPDEPSLTSFTKYHDVLGASDA